MNKIILLFITFVFIIHSNDPQHYAYVDLDYCKSNIFYQEVQPEIKKKITAYQKKFFDDSFVIGVCYMKGSPSLYFAPKIPYKTIYDMLLVHIVEKK